MAMVDLDGSSLTAQVVWLGLWVGGHVALTVVCIHKK